MDNNKTKLSILCCIITTFVRLVQTLRRFKTINLKIISNYFYRRPTHAATSRVKKEYSRCLHSHLIWEHCWCFHAKKLLFLHIAGHLLHLTATLSVTQESGRVVSAIIPNYPEWTFYHSLPLPLKKKTIMVESLPSYSKTKVKNAS